MILLMQINYFQLYNVIYRIFQNHLDLLLTTTFAKVSGFIEITPDKPVVKIGESA
jgi:hypothetical protein